MHFLFLFLYFGGGLVSSFLFFFFPRSKALFSFFVFLSDSFFSFFSWSGGAGGGEGNGAVPCRGVHGYGSTREPEDPTRPVYKKIGSGRVIGSNRVKSDWPVQYPVRVTDLKLKPVTQPEPQLLFFF